MLDHLLRVHYTYTQYDPQGSLGNASVELQYSKPLFFLKFSVLVTLNLTLIFEDSLLLFTFFYLCGYPGFLFIFIEKNEQQLNFGHLRRH